MLYATVQQQLDIKEYKLCGLTCTQCAVVEQRHLFAILSYLSSSLFSYSLITYLLSEASKRNNNKWKIKYRVKHNLYQLSFARAGATQLVVYVGRIEFRRPSSVVRVGNGGG